MGISRSRSGFDEEGIFRCIFLACLSMVESDAYVFFSVEMAEFIMQFYDNSVDSSGEFLFSAMYFKLAMIV